MSLVVSSSVSCASSSQYFVGAGKIAAVAGGEYCRSPSASEVLDRTRCRWPPWYSTVHSLVSQPQALSSATQASSPSTWWTRYCDHPPPRLQPWVTASSVILEKLVLYRTSDKLTFGSFVYIKLALYSQWRLLHNPLVLCRCHYSCFTFPRQSSAPSYTLAFLEDHTPAVTLQHSHSLGTPCTIHHSCITHPRQPWFTSTPHSGKWCNSHHLPFYYLFFL